jgi:hypothetical protein
MPVKPSDLKATFKTLRALLAHYQPPLVAKGNNARQYELWSKKDIEIAGRPRSEVFFASVVVQKSYVGFYYMPVYTNPEMKKIIAPELLALLKGKSCFHVKALDPKLVAHIRRSLQAGYRQYKKNGWV